MRSRRPRYPRSDAPLPPPLPPETRTVGQLVAESLRFYGARFWAVLPLGLALASINQVSAGHRLTVQVLILCAGAPLLTFAYLRASALVSGRALGARAVAIGLPVGTLVFLPAAFLLLLYVLPAVAWLALVGLVVPVIVIEELSPAAALRRALRLSRADYVHALGSLATLVVTFVLTRLVLVLLLHGQGQATGRIAAFLADLVLSPVLLVGSALLYFDQAARVRYSPGERPL